MINVERFLQLINKGEGSEVEFQLRKGMFSITFSRMKSNNVGVDSENVGVDSGNVGVDSENVGADSDVKLSKRQLDLIEIISRDGKVTAKNMSEILSVTLRTVERDLSYLQKNGFIDRKGSDRYGTWIVMKKN